MNPLKDDNQYLDDPAMLTKRMQEKGYLYLREYLNKEKVIFLRDKLLKTLKTLKWVDPASPEGFAIPLLPIRTFRSPEYDQAIPLIQSMEDLHRFAYDEKLTSLMHKVIGFPIVCHATRVVRMINPVSLEKESTVDIHQDYRYVQGTPSTYTAWFPLGDCPQEMGGLRILEGSHNQGVRPVLGLGKSKCGIVDIPNDHSDWASISYKVGDVLVFHSYTIHGPLPNLTKFLRFSADFRYQSVHDPICERALRPFCYPDIADWDVLAKDWTTTQWVQIPESMKIVPYDQVIQNENLEQLI